LTYGIKRVFEKGSDHLVSMIVLFSMTQNVGGLAGSALLGSYQTIQARAHAGALAEHMLASDPQVEERLQGGAAAVSSSLTDPMLRAAEGAAQLGQSMTREANILAYNDVFRAVGILAVLSAIYIAYLILLYGLRRRAAAAGAQS